MTAMDASVRILALIEDDGDRQVFLQWLDQQERYTAVTLSDIDLTTDRFDLCVLDRRALRRHRTELQERKHQQRLYVPYLLIAPETAIKQPTASWADAVNDELVDDILRTPIRPPELDKRLHLLYRYQQQAATLQQTNNRLKLINRIARHDIRNDMTVALGWAEEVTDHVDADGKPMLDHIIASCQNAIGLTKALRDVVAMLHDGEPDLEPVDLVATLKQALTRRQQVHDNATFETDIAPEHVTVAANELLGSVFRNLLDNAVEHNDTDHPVVRTTVTTTTDTVVVRVADNGPGIPPNQRAAVRGRSKQGLDHPAAGLGLYLVDTLVTDYGGSLSIEESELGGAAVIVALPISPEEQP